MQRILHSFLAFLKMTKEGACALSIIPSSLKTAYRELFQPNRSFEINEKIFFTYNPPHFDVHLRHGTGFPAARL